MKKILIPSAKNPGFFIYLILLTGFFLLLEVSFFIQCNRTYFYDFSFVTDNLHIPVTVLPGIFYFLLAQLFVHFIYCCLVWTICSLIINLWRLTENQVILFSIMVWILGMVSACIANQYYFPNSKFAELTAIILVNSTVTKLALIFCLSLDVFILLLALLAVLSFINVIKKSYWFISIFIGLLLGLLALSSFIFLPSHSKKELDAATVLRPNIIFIGVDSLRPDFLSYFGYEKPTPFFDSFLLQASVFSEAVTPLARTYPSWIGILSGLYPREIGIRTNLAQQRANFTNTLPAILQCHGYETIFATDETRFSNVDKNVGFDQLVTPPMGINDFLIGTFNDFPLSNLIINTPVGQYLFPHNYANRPAYFSYDPDSFIHLMAPTLRKQRTKPTFLAVHFCLPHYPYLWSHLNGFEMVLPLERYEASIRRVDKQINDFFVLLQQNHWLDHAIVVLLSDHGEAIELAGDRITEKDLFVPFPSSSKTIPSFYPPSLDHEEVNESAGHGTDVLGLSQNHSLLAFKLYGLGKVKQGLIPGVVSLLDIKPTVLDLLHLPSPESSGKSLILALETGQRLPLKGPIFLESDFSPEAIRTVYPETRKALLDGVELFKIDPATTRLFVKDDMEKMIIRSKQYANIYGDWILALYPQADEVYMPILVNLVTGKWSNDLKSSFALLSPAYLMLDQLKTFYGDEIKTISVSG